MKNLKKILLFLGAVSLVAFGATNFRKSDKKETAENNVTTSVEETTENKSEEAVMETAENAENVSENENSNKKNIEIAANTVRKPNKKN